MDQLKLINLKKIYKNKNYEIIIKKSNFDKCFVFFSGNGLYFPNTNQEFNKKIIIDNRYEWKNLSKHINAKKIILLRDVHKIWYRKGINHKINNIDKVIAFIKKETEKFSEIVLIGSSAGGYMASIIGNHLKNSYVINFAGQIDLKLENIPLKKNKYFNIIKKINKAKIFYFFSNKCKLDYPHFKIIKNKKNITFFKFNSINHGPSILPIVLRKILNMRYEELIEIKKNNKDLINPLKFSLSIVNPLSLIISWSIKHLKRIRYEQ